MSKPIEVREFDSITCNRECADSGRYKYLDSKDFQTLLDFIAEFAGDEDRADALNFMRIGFRRDAGKTITFNNYVGVIQMKNGSQVQVLPKIDFGDGEDDGTRTKKVFLKMLKSMKDVPYKIFNDSSINIDNMNLYELFINMYLQAVRQLVKHGIKSNYVTQEDNLNHYKGKLLTSQHIRKNLAHKEKFYMAYDEFHPNMPENKLIKATLLKLQRITSSEENSKEIRQLLGAFEMVEASSNYVKDFAKVTITRTNREYEKLMIWSKVFLTNKSFTTFSGSTASRALLFPMETVYESYVAQEMKKLFIPKGWDVSSQDKGFYLFTRPNEQFALRPDIVLRKGDRTVVLDTKWKRLDKESKNYGISQSDMYQMYAYSKKYGASDVWLLYPIINEMRDHEPIVFDSGDSTKVHVYFVDVDRISESLSGLRI